MSNNDDHQPDFKHWAITGIMVPFFAIMFLTFFVAPQLWGPELARKLGESLGRLFALYLLCVAAVSIIWKASHRNRDRHKRDKE